MKDFVVYTVLVGGYGDIHQPEYVDERFDYILFTTDTIPDPGVWQVRSFPAVPEGDNRRISRYPKTHPVSLLNGYKASLYQDANIIIRDRWVYDRCIELFRSDADIAGVQLLATGRDCIYEHSFDMFMMKAEHDYNALRQMQALRQRGFPDHFGLNENNVIWRRHCPLVEKVDDEWWWWITNYSYRDQFSYMYCLWNNGIARTLFLPVGEDTNNSVHFTRINHNALPSVSRRKWIKRDADEKWRCFCRRLPGNRDASLKEWVELSKRSDPDQALQQWGQTAFKQYLKRILK